MKLVRSVKVKIGVRPGHSEHNSLADAFNNRILSGLGDCAWRIFYYAYSTFRGLRNPNGDQYPAQDEWFKFYANIEPKMSYGKFSWPETPAGYPEGANTANPFMAWIFGNAGRVTALNGEKDATYTRIHGYWSELTRLGGLEIYSPAPMPRDEYGHSNLNIIWHDSELQRGCAAYVKPYNYVFSVPQKQTESGQTELKLLSFGIVAAARKHLRFVMECPSLGRYAPSFVPYNGKGGVFRKKYAAKDQIGQAMFCYLSYFRGTEDQRAKHNLTGNDVATDGFDFETFFSQQFLLAPNYSSPRFEKGDDGFPKIDPLGNNQIKYDGLGYPELFPQSLTLRWNWKLQYADKLNIITTAHNADFLFQGLKGSEFDTNPDPQNDLDRFCLSAIFIQSSDFASKYEYVSNTLLEGLLIDMYLNGKLYETIPILPDFKYGVDRTTGEASEAFKFTYLQYQVYQFNKIHYFEYPIKGKVSFRVRATKNVDTPTVKRHGNVNLGLKITNPNLLTEFSILIKFAHVLEMKPSSADAYAIMRLATTREENGKIGGMDPAGHFDSDLAKKVFANYIRFGVAYSLQNKSLGTNDAYVSTNPVYESVRKFISSHIKMADRYALVDYEVTPDYKSILYFRRFPLGMKNIGIDAFRGIAPSITQVGNRNMIGSVTETFIPIIQGKRYVVIDLDRVSTSYVHYISGASVLVLKHSCEFVGSYYHYISFFSSPRIGVYELDGIVTRALLSKASSSEITVDEEPQKSPGLITNEWSMFMSYNLYHPSESSAWKPSGYGDIMGALNARCLTSSLALEGRRPTSKNVKLHLANVNWKPITKPLSVESPSAYHYIEGANSDLSYSDWQERNDYVKAFSSSCPVYQKPYYIESVTKVNPLDPKCDVIKVSINGRLRGGAGAPDANSDGSAPTLNLFRQGAVGKVSENRYYWGGHMQQQTVRYDENAVVGYLMHTLFGKHCSKEVVGDVALDNQDFWGGNRPWGCCYPRFYFTKLIPYVSVNSTMYSDHYRQMEYYLRAMCNGFINTNSELSSEEIKKVIDNQDLGTLDVGGYDSAVGDYLFEDLMIDSYDNSGQNRVAVKPNMSSGASS